MRGRIAREVKGNSYMILKTNKYCFSALRDPGSDSELETRRDGCDCDNATSFKFLFRVFEKGCRSEHSNASKIIIPETFKRQHRVYAFRLSYCLCSQALSAVQNQHEAISDSDEATIEGDVEMDENPEIPIVVPLIKEESAATPPPPTTQQPNIKEPRSRLVIHKLVLVNFKSYAKRQTIGPFHKVFPRSTALALSLTPIRPVFLGDRRTKRFRKVKHHRCALVCFRISRLEDATGEAIRAHPQLGSIPKPR
jgi:hypothetical protein